MRKSALCRLGMWFFVAPLVLSASPAPQWTVHSKPGYSVQSPPGWTVSQDSRSGWVRLAGTQGEEVVIWPVFVAGEIAAPDLSAARAIHLKLASECPYRADWGVPQAAGTRILRATAQDRGMAAVSLFTWAASPRGTAAFFYLAAARDSEFRREQGDLARILDSFRLAGAAGGKPTASLRFVSFRDPREGSFTVDVPAGWRTAGGLFRVSPFVSRIAVRTDSPDGRTKVALGDAELPSSFRESLPGSPPWAVGPVGSEVMGSIVYPYMTGAAYCHYYIQNRIEPFCSDLRITDVEDGPLVENPAPMPLTASTQFTVGSVSFSCREQGKPRVGACTAKTRRSIPPPQIQSPMSTWGVELLMAYIAPPEEAKQVETVMFRMRDSFRVDTQWGMLEIRGAGDRSRIISSAAQDIARMTESSQRHRDAIDDRIARLRSDANLGVSQVVDPATGRHMSVDSGSDYYWVDHRGVVLGTDVDTSPGVDFRRLLELSSR